MNKGDPKDSELRITPSAISALAQGDIDNFLTAAVPGGIEAQEATGQRQLVQGTKLPVQTCVVYPPREGFWSREWIRSWEILESWGVKFWLYDSERDPLFVDAKLPPGWKKISTDHSMWSYLLDDLDRQRASIFFKAAFYDRRASMRLHSRIQYEYDYDLERRGVFIGRVIADKAGYLETPGYRFYTTLFETEHLNIVGPSRQEANTAHDSVYEQAREWADAHYPRWREADAYWDDELDGVRHDVLLESVSLA